MYILYRHISPSGKVYIGITKRKPEYRWNKGKGYGLDLKIFHAAILKYGWDNIKHEILFKNLTEEKAKNLEIALIKHYKSLGISYNITDGGDGTTGAGWTHAGWKHSKETKQHFSNIRKDTKAGKKNPMYGRHETAPAYGKFGKEHPASKKVYLYSLNLEFIKEWDSMTEAAISLGRTLKEVTHITACCNGRAKTALGYVWRRELIK